MSELNKVLSERGKELIIINGYKFRFHKNLAHDMQRWKCTKSSCKSFIKTSQLGTILEEPGEHCHPPFETKDIQRQHINNQLKRKAVENICDRPLKILHQLIYFTP
uniref:FLYWCH-type domain-containing protein n=1 Tax=Cacopsylla melanoneura TaxID=428564 RepID=A0A8D9A100_9HEMI